MAFVVEDGTGLTNANSFISLAYANTYFTDKGVSSWSGTDASKEAALVRASSYLTTAYLWKGSKINERSQALAFPRSGVYDLEGYEVAQDAVPIEIQISTAELALLELLTPSTLNPAVKLSERVSREQIGQISVDYVNSNISASSDIVVVPYVLSLISGLIVSGGANRLSGASVRS
jgi:hypothetical protein